MKKYILLLIIFIFSLNADGQTVLRGKITDLSDGNPLIGVFVSIKGMKIAAVSELDGTYQIIVPSASKSQRLFIATNHLGYIDGLEVVEILPIDDGETIVRNFELEPDPLTLKDITVTANRVEEELQDVPIAATVITALDMQERTVSDTEEALSIVPNLVTDSYLPSRATFSLRGLSSDFTNLGVENSVGLYIDDVFYSRSFNFNQTLMDIERVEVLRGPQGTLFGKNTIGGVLHVISEAPKFDNFAAFELNAGNFNYLQVRGKANVELLNDKLAMRVSGAYRKRDGWLLERNTELSDENGITFYGTRASFLYQINDKMDFTVKGTYTKDDRADFTIDYKTPEDGIDRIPVLVNGEIDETISKDRKVFQNEDVFFNRKNYGGVGKFNWKMNDIHTLTSITAYNGSESAFLRDFDASTANVGTFGKVSEINTFSQELRITTPRENRKFFYVGGLFYLNEKLSNSDTLRAREDMVPIWESAILRATGMDVTLPEDYEEAVFNNSQIDSKSYAAYLSTSYEFSERVRLNAGLRFSREEKSIQYYQGCQCLDSPIKPLAVLVAMPAGSAEAPLTKDIDNNAFSGNVGLDFKTTDKALVYVNFSRGFKGAGFNVSLSPEADISKLPFTFKPEIINSYEIGLKLKANNRFLFNAAAFVTDFQNKQEVVAVGNTVIVANADAVQGQGAEIEFTGIWTDFFKTHVALGALNLKYTNFPFDNPFTPNVEENLSGNFAFKAAPFTFKFSPEVYTKVGKELKLLIRADYNFVGKTYNDIFNTEGLARQATGTLNARVAISTKNERFGIALWAKNLTNETYVQHGWSFVFGDHVAINPPRTIGMELRVNFY
mgnify:CR=1 FL=1